MRFTPLLGLTFNEATTANTTLLISTKKQIAAHAYCRFKRARTGAENIIDESARQGRCQRLLKTGEAIQTPKAHGPKYWEDYWRRQTD